MESSTGLIATIKRYSTGEILIHHADEWSESLGLGYQLTTLGVRVQATPDDALWLKRADESLPFGGLERTGEWRQAPTGEYWTTVGHIEGAD